MLSQFFADGVSAWWPWIAGGISAGLGILLVRRLTTVKMCPYVSMTGKTVVITGANSGIGKAAATELAARHARVIMACRDIPSAERAAAEIRQCTKNGELIVRKLDLSSLKSVREFATQICHEEVCVHVLVNNAGVFQCPHQLTEDGLEMQMAANHFGHFLLVHLLLDKLKASVPSRIIVVSSGLHKYGRIDFDDLNGMQHYDKKAAYSASKLANNLFARELARRTDGSGVSVYCLRPGMVRTNLGRHMPLFGVLRVLAFPLLWLLMKSAHEGCQTVVYCASMPDIQKSSGLFYADCKEEQWSNVSLDDNAASKLWEVSEKTTGVQHSL